MANPTPRTDALRAMREAKFEAEQRRMKQEAGKPAGASGAAVKPIVASDDAEPATVENAVTKKTLAKTAIVKETVAKKATAKKAAAKKPAKAKAAKKAD
jgi:hypothetical protein